jgi:hypothetical protein
MKSRRGEGTKDECLQLKYCERCGGLWLRPVNGGQIYCTVCSHEMAKLPPPSSKSESASGPHRRGLMEDDGFERYLIEAFDPELPGGRS